MPATWIKDQHCPGMNNACIPKSVLPELLHSLNVLENAVVQQEMAVSRILIAGMDATEASAVLKTMTDSLNTSRERFFKIERAILGASGEH
jgi:hypothetical protein